MELQFVWGPTFMDGAESWQDGSPNFILDQEGIHAIYLRDTWGDGPNGGGFEVVGRCWNVQWIN